MAYEIELPITKPQTEWVRGRALRKMSPTRDHSRLQTKFAAALDAWAQGSHGEVGTEWRFRIAVTNEPRRPLVPDIAFIAKDLLVENSRSDLQSPTFAPTVVVEILAPGDSELDIASKTDVYLRGGTALVVIVDPTTRTVALHDVASTRVLGAGDILTHPALPGFALDLGHLFVEALDRSDPAADR